MPTIFWSFVLFICCSFGTNIVPKFIGNKSVGINLESFFDKLLGWFTRIALKDLYLMLVCKKYFNYVMIGFFILFLLSPKHITNSSFEPNFHSELELESSSLSTLLASLGECFKFSSSWPEFWSS